MSNLMEPYADLASVYELLTPEPLLTPEGNVAAFAPWIDPLPRARACSTARPASAGWPSGLRCAGSSSRRPTPARRWSRARARSPPGAASTPARVCAWEELRGEPRFDAVFCVGNSLAHAAGPPRRAARRWPPCCKPGGAARDHLAQLGARARRRLAARGRRPALERHGRRACRATRGSIPDGWREPHTARRRRLARRPTAGGDRHRAPDGLAVHAAELADDLRAAGLEPERARSRPRSSATWSRAKIKACRL